MDILPHFAVISRLFGYMIKQRDFRKVILPKNALFYKCFGRYVLSNPTAASLTRTQVISHQVALIIQQIRMLFIVKIRYGVYASFIAAEKFA